MTPHQLIKHYGSAAKAAAALGTDRQVVHGWKKRGSIPLDQQCRYEVLTEGKLIADVPEGFRESVAAA